MVPKRRGPSHAEQPLYYFRTENTRPGDILLNTNPNHWLSTTIRKATKSPISHAAICSDLGVFVEALGPGVHILALDQTATAYPESLRFLRLRADIPNATTIARMAG